MTKFRFSLKNVATIVACFAVMLMAACEEDVAVVGVSLNKTTLTLEISATEMLKATVSPNDASNKDVTWASDKSAVAEVSGGTVTAKSAGTAIITVTTVDGGKTATCTVTVTAPSPVVTEFTVQFVANGSVTAPAVQTVAKDGKATEPPAMTNPNHEDFNGWYANADFTGSTYDFNTPVTANLKLYAKWGYKVGDTGPAGGKVFYVKSGATYPNWKYLEVSPAVVGGMSTAGLFQWANGVYSDGSNPQGAVDYIVEGAKGTAIGTGRANTDAILAMLSFTPYPGEPFVKVPAAKSAEDYTAGGYSDWFLPSKDELNALYQSNLIPLSKFRGFDVWYWSSSQHHDAGRNQCAWAQSFGNDDAGMQNEENKTPARYPKETDDELGGIFVRPIRSFFCSHDE